MLEYMKSEIETLDEELRQIETITASDNIKILQNNRRAIKINFHTLAAYFRRYKKDKRKKNELIQSMKL